MDGPTASHPTTYCTHRIDKMDKLTAGHLLQERGWQHIVNNSSGKEQRYIIFSAWHIQLEVIYTVQQVAEALLHLGSLDDFMVQAGQQSCCQLMLPAHSINLDIQPVVECRNIVAVKCMTMQRKLSAELGGQSQGVDMTGTKVGQHSTYSTIMMQQQIVTHKHRPMPLVKAVFMMLTCHSCPWPK